MSLYERVKNSVLDTPFVRDYVTNSSSTAQYYKDLTLALKVEGFPLIPIDTIEKKTYIIECQKQYFLVFDYYLLDVIQSMSDMILNSDSREDVRAFLYRISSEECFIQGRISSAIKFSSLYLNRLDTVLARQKNVSCSHNSSNYLFVQQAFLIAHELFHYYVHSNPTQEIKGMISKERFLQKIYNYTQKRDPETAISMGEVIGNPNMIEECLCDSTAVIQAIDVGQKTGKIDPVQSGIAVAIALMCQFTLSIIQDAVKYSGEIVYDRIQSLFNFRLLHLKEFTSLYIKEIDSVESEKNYQISVETVRNNWMTKVLLPIIVMLADNKESFLKEPNTSENDPEQLRRACTVLRQIYRCAI